MSGEPPPDDETARESRDWLAIPRRLWISLTRSFRARLLLASSAVLGLTLILIGLSVNQAYTQGTWQAQRDRMQGLVYALVGAAEPDQSGELTIASDALPDPRLSRFQSGVEAVIFNEKGHAIWRSPNLSGALPKIIAPQVGDSILRKVNHDFVLSFGIRWFTGDGRPKRYTVALLQDGNNYNAQLNAFRHTLTLELGAAAAFLITIQFLLLRWGMSPLRSLANEIHAIERGESSEIAGTYPSELMPLAENLNAMIRTGYAQMARYRNALGDLAHSLKTPLAVLRGVSEDPALPPRWREALADPLQRIQQLGDQELRRAATAGRRVMAEPLLLRPLGDRILEAMAKVHVERHLRLLNLVDPRLRARVDASDLYDVLGNLLDNACKWASTQVRLSASQSTSELLLEVEDDGPGFPPQAERLLERGVRADTRVSGQGIGLATVSDIVSLSEGRLELGTSPLGGARVRVLLPR